MGNPVGDLIRGQARSGAQQFAGGLRTMRQRGPGKLQFWLIALVIGIAAGFAAVGFRLSIAWLQELIYGASDTVLASHLAGLHWGWVLAVPILGGLTVGLITHHFTDDKGVRTVAHVIEAAALRDGQPPLFCELNHRVPCNAGEDAAA